MAIFSESCIFMYFSTFLENVVKSAKLPNLGSMWPNIGPTQAQHGRKMAQRPQHRTYGFIDWNSGANTLVRAVVIAKRPEYQQSKLRIFFLFGEIPSVLGRQGDHTLGDTTKEWWVSAVHVGNHNFVYFVKTNCYLFWLVFILSFSYWFLFWRPWISFISFLYMFASSI